MRRGPGVAPLYHAKTCAGGLLRDQLQALLIFRHVSRSIKYLVKIGTPVHTGYDVKTLCVHGPFEFFKHPMYCAMMGCSLATVLTNDSLCEGPIPLLRGYCHTLDRWIYQNGRSCYV